MNLINLLIIQNKQKMFGKVTLSHALALGSLEEAAIRDIAQNSSKQVLI